jgi:hypothetical protein
MTCTLIADPTNQATAVAKSTFTCTSTRHTAYHRSPAPQPCGVTSLEVEEEQQHRLWLAQQKQSVKAYRDCLQEAFIHRCVHDAQMTEQQRQAAIKILCAEASRHHVTEAKKHTNVQPAHALNEDSEAPAPPMSIITYELSWWRNFASQVQSFLTTATAAALANNVAPSQQASENISSLGMWHVGQGIGMSSRQYSVLALSHHIVTPTTVQETAHGDVTNCQDHNESIHVPATSCSYTPVYKAVVLVGLCQFGYSNFVQNARAQAQINVLQNLQAAGSCVSLAGSAIAAN